MLAEKAHEKQRQSEFKKDQRVAHFKVGYDANGKAKSIPKPPSMLQMSGANIAQKQQPQFAGGSLGNQYKAAKAMIEKNRASNIVYAGGRSQTG